MNYNTKKIFSIFIKKCINFTKSKLVSTDNISNIKTMEDSEIELIKYNAELERKKLAKELGLSLNCSWKEIVKKNNKIIEKENIRIK